MAIDAISSLDITYEIPVRYYLANLGTTMESQVRSFVSLPPLSLCRHRILYHNPFSSSPLAPRCVPRSLERTLPRPSSSPPFLAPFLILVTRRSASCPPRLCNSSNQDLAALSPPGTTTTQSSPAAARLSRTIP